MFSIEFDHPVPPFVCFEWLSKKNCDLFSTYEAGSITSFKRVRAFQIELEFGSVGFLGEGKTGVPGYFHVSLSFVAVLFEF